MSLGDFILRQQFTEMGSGAHGYNVASGTAILAGEPVMIRAVGNVVVEPMLTNSPTVSVSAGVEGLFVGIAATNSTNTATASGFVDVVPTNSALTYLGNPDVAATWLTQSQYDALVGKRVLIKNSVAVTSTPTGGAYTVLASDSANNGCTVQALNVFKYPGKVAIAFRTGTSNLL